MNPLDVFGRMHQAWGQLAGCVAPDVVDLFFLNFFKFGGLAKILFMSRSTALVSPQKGTAMIFSTVGDSFSSRV